MVKKYNLIIVLPIFETKQGVTILKKPQEELINWYLLFATSFQHMQHKRNRLRSGIDVENWFSSWISHFTATYHGKNWVLDTASWMLYWQFNFLFVASNFVKWIQNSCHWIKFDTLPFVLSNRLRSVDMFGVFVLSFLLWIRQLSFQHLETFLSSCLSGLLFSNVYFLYKTLC